MVLIWYLFLQLVSFSTWGLIWRLLPSSPDLGLGFSKYIGLCLLTITSFVICTYGHVPFSHDVVAILVCGYCVIGGYCAYRSRTTLMNIFRAQGKFIEAVFLLSFVFFLVLRAFQPEIFWGEKPMDSTFLNFFVRTDTLPPTDPWASGSKLLYYYFGYIFYAIPLKLLSIDTGSGYNLSLATIGASHCTVLFSLLLRLISSPIFSALGAILICIGGNADTLYRSIFEKKILNFDFFWATSRTLTSPAFNEYPIWGFMFGDLHAHLITLPLTVIILGLGIEILSTGLLSTTALTAILTASLIGFNAWDIIPLGLTGGMMCLFGGKLSLQRIPQGIVFLLLFTTLYFLFHPHVAPGNGIHYGWVFPEEFNSLTLILRHFGIFILILLLGLPFLFYGTYDKKTLLRSFIFFIPISLFFQFSKSPHIASLIVYPCVALSSVLLSLSQGKRKKFEVKILLILSSLGVLLIPLIEHIFFMDRMNTTFKFNHMVWTLLGVGSCGLLKLIFDASNEKILGKTLSGCTRSILTLPIAASIASSTILMIALLPFHRISGPRPTLDGRAYLKEHDGDESQLIAWINHNISGTPVMAEAVGISYAEFTRMSMHTGLPVILGWGYHVTQRGTSSDEVEERKRDIEQIYRSNDRELSYMLLKKYKTKFLIFGNLEKRVYGKDSFERFLNDELHYKVVFTSGAATIFEVL